MTQKNIVPHKSVLTQEVLTYLNPQPHKTYLDVTFGVGGHTRAILQKEPTCKVIALDWDTNAIENYGRPLQEEFPERLMFLWGNFALLYKILKKAGINKVDGILADFGTSQVQITEQSGFSIYRDTPLDMRMSKAHFKETAYDLVNWGNEQKLCKIFWDFGEERYTKQIVAAIIAARKKKRIKTTKELADIIVAVVPKQRKRTIHPATRVFQALRIYVNKELDNITSFLAKAVHVLNPHGRLVCISFHSLEDRLVKQFFKDQSLLGTVDLITSKAITASEQELENNPSSRSAKLRAVERI